MKTCKKQPQLGQIRFVSSTDRNWHAGYDARPYWDEDFVLHGSAKG
jgi:hypothetical protein